MIAGEVRRAISMLTVLACGACASCAAGKFPSALSERPLTMPEGEHEIVAGLGVRNRHAKLEFDSKLIALGYRYGITDDIEVGLPLVIGLRSQIDDALEVLIRAGLSGFGYSSRESVILVGTFNGGMKLHLSGGRALTAGFGASRSISGNSDSAAGLGLGFMQDVASWISFTASVSGQVDKSRFRPTIASFTPGSIGLSLHALDVLDVVAETSVKYTPSTRATDVVVRGGIDLHWD